MIYSDVTITVKGNTATLDNDLYLYKNDKNITINISIVNSIWNFAKKLENNIIEKTEATFFTLRWMKGDKVKKVFEDQQIKKGKCEFVITEELIDEDIEMGDYDFQISLLDEEKNSILSIPPVIEQIHINKHIFEDEDINTVGNAKVGIAKVGTYEQRSTENSEGLYNKKTWQDNEVITKEDLNTIEEGIYNNSTQCKDIAKQIENIGTGGTGGSLNLSNYTDDIIFSLVDKIINCTNISLNNTAINFINTDTQTIIATVTPSDTTENIIWETSNNTIATVNNGVVTPLKNGSCIITATCGNYSATCNVTVNLPNTYTITNNLSNASNSNSKQIIEANTSYIATITANEDYDISSVIVTMGGVDITNTVYSNGNINIANVTGNIIITVNTTAKSSNLVTNGLIAHVDMADGRAGDTSITDKINNRVLTLAKVNNSNGECDADFTGKSFKITKGAYLFKDDSFTLNSNVATLEWCGVYNSGVFTGFSGNMGKGFYAMLNNNFIIFRNNVQIKASSSNYTKGIFMHIAVVFDTNKITAYLNGEEWYSSEGDYSNVITHTPLLLCNNSPTLNGLHSQNSELYSAKMYNVPLSKAEVQQNYRYEKKINRTV